MPSVTFLLLMASSAFASYRVYELELTHYDGRGKAVRQEKVMSTLDHLQYEHYHSGFRNMKARLVDTWYCPGDTSRKVYCEKPKEAPTRGPASTQAKRLPLGRQPVIP